MFSAGLVLLPIIFYPLLVFSENIKYIGDNNMNNQFNNYNNFSNQNNQNNRNNQNNQDFNYNNFSNQNNTYSQYGNISQNNKGKDNISVDQKSNSTFMQVNPYLSYKHFSEDSNYADPEPPKPPVEILSGQEENKKVSYVASALVGGNSQPINANMQSQSNPNMNINNQQYNNQNYQNIYSNNQMYSQQANNNVNISQNGQDFQFSNYNANQFFNSSPNNNTISHPTNANYNNINSTSQSNNENVNIDRDELLRSFVGNNYDKIKTKPFNIAGFLFSTFYMFYRKMFLYGIIAFIISFILTNVTKLKIFSAIITVIIGLFVNKIYLYYANKKIDKIILNNPNKSIDEIKDICSKTGGTSVSRIILGFFVELSIFFITLIVMSIIGFASIFGDLFTNNNVNVNANMGTEDNKSNENSTYNGILITDTSVTILDEFNIDIPNIFEEGMFNSDETINYVFESNNGVFDDCQFSLSSVNNYSSAENLINQMQKYNSDDNPTNVTNSNINDISWYWFSYNNNFGQTYYYGTTKGNKVYLFEYEIQIDSDSSCPTYKDQVLNSITKK